MQITPDDLTDITDRARYAFWQVLVEKYPQATTGDLSPMTSIRLQLAAETAVEEWVHYNVPPFNE